MTHYIHHLPGRLRVKSPHYKRNAQRAHEARVHLGEVDGVLSTEANPLTGSLLITYDVNRVGGERVLDALRRLGHLDAKHVGTGYTANANDPIQRLTDRVVDKLVETAIERSASALIGAVL